MTQEKRWTIRYYEVVEFIENNIRNSSKHRIEEHDMLNWVKDNRRLLNAGVHKEDRIEAFKKLLEMCERYRRVNY